MNVLSRDQQIHIIACLTEGMSIRATERMTGVHRDTIMRLGAKVGRGCAELHDRMMVGIRTGRLELDELWAYVGKKQRHMKHTDSHQEKGDQYTFVALASSTRAIVGYRTGKRDTATTQEFMADLSERVLGAPEISTDGFKPYQPAVRDSFKHSAHGVISKTYSVTHLGMKAAQHRYSPAAVIAVEREVMYGVPADISTSYVERSNLSMRMACRRFTRLTNGFSKKLDNHAAAVSLYVGHYNLCRVHESLRSTPAMALGIAERVWTIGDLLDAALATQSIDPVVTAPDRRRRFTIIEGGKRSD
jgi:IS1 family transposase